MPRVALLSASYTAQSLKANAQRCINLYPEANPPDAPAPVTFYGTPGLLLWSTMPGSGAVRGLFKASTGTLFGAQGNKLYRYASGSWTELATLGSSSGVVVFADNGVSGVFVDGTTTAPTVNLSSFAASALAGDGWYGADFVRYLDGFFIFNHPGTQQFYISGALDLTLDALDFASAESNPDKLISVMVDHEEAWMFGETTTEIFVNTGNADFPFERRNGATLETGCVAKHSPAKLDNSIVWLGGDERGDGIVWRVQGYQPVRISTHALENEIRGYGAISDAQAYSYQQNGHSFYVLTFPTAGKTWVYDAASGMWHERAYRKSDGALIRHRSNCHVFYERKHLVGDFENGKVYELDLGTYTDNGDVIRRTKGFQHLVSDGRRQFFSSFEADMEMGVGNADDPDPQVWLSHSDDGANTWSAIRTMSIGKIGEYGRRARLNRLGMGRDRVFEISTTAKTKVVLQGAFIDARPGLS